MNALMAVHWRVVALAAVMALTLGGCESMGLSQMGKRIDYKSAGAGPSLELPPDLTKPQYDDRYAVTSASELAAKNASRPKQSDLLPVNTGDVRIGRAGSERWLVVKATPEQAWSNVRKFWVDNGFVIATEQPALGVMETDWAENRAEIPQDVFRKYIGKYIDVFYSTYKRDKFRTRIERGTEPGTVEIYVSHRGMEQVPTVKIDNVQPAAFAWAAMPPNPNLEAEMLSRLMVRFGAPEAQAVAAASPGGHAGGARPRTAREERRRHLEARRRRSVRPRVAARRPGARPHRLHRRRSRPLDGHLFRPLRRSRRRHGEERQRKGLPVEGADRSGRPTRRTSPSSTGSRSSRPAPQSTVSVQDPNGAPDRTQASEKILALLRDQLK